jgi:hypothetical protein
MHIPIGIKRISSVSHPEKGYCIKILGNFISEMQKRGHGLSMAYAYEFER